MKVAGWTRLWQLYKIWRFSFTRLLYEYIHVLKGNHKRAQLKFINYITEKILIIHKIKKNENTVHK